MKREIIETLDGSHTIYMPDLDEQYHSLHGALQESMHVFIEMGWKAAVEGKKKVRVLEIGFGTGLNALLTVRAAFGGAVHVNYTGIEAYPLIASEYERLNYGKLLEDWPAAVDVLQALHIAPWESETEIVEGFRLQKMESRIENFELTEPVDLIYFDAFAPDKQPELWTDEIFKRMYYYCAPGAFLVTYCAKGDVRRSMIAAGFTVSRIPGPPGKREMLRAWKRN